MPLIKCTKCGALFPQNTPNAKCSICGGALTGIVASKKPAASIGASRPMASIIEKPKSQQPEPAQGASFAVKQPEQPPQRQIQQQSQPQQQQQSKSHKSSIFDSIFPHKPKPAEEKEQTENKQVKIQAGRRLPPSVIPPQKAQTKSEDPSKAAKNVKQEQNAEQKKQNVSGYVQQGKNKVIQNRYEILRPIKRGGMGAIYEILDKRLHKKWALKEMIETFDNEQECKEAKERFEREAMLLASLNHPNLPRVIDFFEENERFYLVMDYIAGIDLNDLIKQKQDRRLPISQVISIAADILNILDYLHHRNPPIIYRDIKPGNIMIRTEDSKTVLIDFGIARAISQDSTDPKTEVGTVGYAPPEQYTGNPLPCSDLYALGATMHELISGIPPKIPFQFAPLKEIIPNIPEEINFLITKSLELNHNDRWQTAAEMLKYLNQNVIRVKEHQEMPTPQFQSVGIPDEKEEKLKAQVKTPQNKVVELTNFTPKSQAVQEIPFSNVSNLSLENLNSTLKPSAPHQLSPVVELGHYPHTLPNRQQDQTIRNKVNQFYPENPSIIQDKIIEIPKQPAQPSPMAAAAAQAQGSNTYSMPAGGVYLPETPQEYTNQTPEMSQPIKSLEYQSHKSIHDYAVKFKNPSIVLENKNPIANIKFHPIRETICILDKNGELKVKDLKTMKEISTVQTGFEGLSAIDFTADGSLFAYNSKYNECSILDAKTLSSINKFAVEDCNIVQVIFHPYEPLLIAGCDDGTIIKFDYLDGKKSELRYKKNPITAMDLSTDGKNIFTGHINGNINVWNTKDEIMQYTVKEHKAKINCISIAPHNKLLASCSEDKTIILWSTANLSQVRKLSDHQAGSVYSVAYIINNPYLAAVTADKTFRIWDVKTGKNIAAYTSEAKFNTVRIKNYKDNSYIAAAGDNNLVIWHNL